MRSQTAPKLSKWPFLLADILLLGLATLIFLQSKRPMGPWEILACTLCAAVGASCGALPFILEYRVLVKLIIADHLVTVASEIRKLDQVAAQIGSATGLWQSVQESADKTAQNAKTIAERMAAELKEFNRFLQQANEIEKSGLRLEVEKLRRAESDWLQVLVRMLDHVFALHQAALRSRQPSLIEQLGLFQNSCRDAARRVGLTPFVAAPEELFDQQRHQVADDAPPPEPGDTVAETVASGYTFQGRLLRPALVRLHNGNDSSNEVSSAATEDPQSQLSLESPAP